MSVYGWQASTEAYLIPGYVVCGCLRDSRSLPQLVIAAACCSVHYPQIIRPAPVSLPLVQHYRDCNACCPLQQLPPRNRATPRGRECCFASLLPNHLGCCLSTSIEMCRTVPGAPKQQLPAACAFTDAWHYMCYCIHLGDQACQRQPTRFLSIENSSHRAIQLQKDKLCLHAIAVASRPSL